MSLYIVTLSGHYGTETGNPFVNVFTYNVDDILPTSALATSLANEFASVVVDSTAGLKTILQGSATLDSIIVTCPFNPSVLGVEIIAVVGSRAGGAMPRFVAWGYKSERTRGDIRSGFKRFGAISESDTSGTEPTAAMLVVLGDFADQLNTTLGVDDGVSSYSAVPVIVKRVAYTTPSGNTAYRMPESPSEYVYMNAEWVFQSITSQNSRKA